MHLCLPCHFTPVVIDTLDAADRACVTLLNQRVIALDLEGAPLADRISLLQIASGDGSTEVFLFDVLALGQSLFQKTRLGSILSDPTVLKLCYDCRGIPCLLALSPRYVGTRQ
jgi:ribonuclease D